MKTLDVLAPAKINLYLHVTGKRADGYHLLDSLVVFSDTGDKLLLTEAEKFSFTIEGPFARAFSAAERDESRESKNLAVRAIWAIADAIGKEPNFKLTLKKNIPLSAGIGGGSSDAAAAIWGILDWFGMPVSSVHHFEDILLGLGADVPVCMQCQPARFTGIGEVVEPLERMEEFPILLVYPAKGCSTIDIFKNFDGSYKDVLETLPLNSTMPEMLKFLKMQHNDLTAGAIKNNPLIEKALAAIKAQEGCALSRMSGSGSTCFGIFENIEDAQEAATNIALLFPDWWVNVGMANRPQRY